ncbi:uncharacterized protein A4U43_C08F23700 [Asparagus officinalis]|nr:uncharacterized protein A4U43_C08F23700 [Asparagus officinalis]
MASSGETLTPVATRPHLPKWGKDSSGPTASTPAHMLINCATISSPGTVVTERGSSSCTLGLLVIASLCLPLYKATKSFGIGSSEGVNVTNQALRHYGVTKPISTAGASNVDLQRSVELEKFLVDVGLYESKEEVVKREEVLGQIDQV